MLTATGLCLNFIGSIILLGSEVKPINRLLKRCDPIHFAYKQGLDYIVKTSIDTELIDKRRAHPYSGKVKPGFWRWWPLRSILSRHAEQDIPLYPTINIQGGWFKIDGTQLTFPEERIINLNENRRLDSGNTISLQIIYGLLYEARMKRIYIYGVSLLGLGFLLQFIDSIGLSTFFEIYNSIV